MTLAEASTLPCGLYRIYWKSDPDRPSLAAVGMGEDETRWLAPTNWVAPVTDGSYWRHVKRVEPVVVLTTELVDAAIRRALEANYQDMEREFVHGTGDPNRPPVGFLKSTSHE